MGTITAARAARNLPASSQTFPLGKGTAMVFDAAADVDPILWAETFRGEAKDAVYYNLLDRTMTEGFVYRYLVLLAADGKPYALQPLILVHQDLAISLGPRKDFPATGREEMEPLGKARFTRLDGLPSLKLEFDFSSFEQYFREKLSRVTRKSLRRKFRESDAATPPLTLEVRNDCREVIDEIYPLYRAVADRSAVEFEVFTREYFLEASRTMPERCRFFIWRQADKAVAFSYCTVWDETLFDHDLGLDYAVAHNLHLYYVTFRDLVTWALSHGLRTYRTSPFNYEPKMHLRLAPEPVDLFVRHRSPFLKGMLRVFAPRFSLSRSDPVLRRHFSARS